MAFQLVNPSVIKQGAAMPGDEHKLFDFADHAAESERNVDLIRQFAAAEPFRSAMVEELELDDDFYRRPLRPEDLSFIKFNEPLSSATVTQLPFLATQRMLLCLNELEIARLPRDGEDELTRFAHFYGGESRILGARIRPFLESFAFDFLTDFASSQRNTTDLVFDLEQLLKQEVGFWSDSFHLLVRRNYLEEGLRFILLQKWCLAPTRRAALGRAAASGFFDVLDAADRPVIAQQSEEEALFRRIAVWCQVPKQEHSYWQFYLSTSLSEVNLLYALAARPDKALALMGAAFAAEASWVALRGLIEQSGPCFGMGSREQLSRRQEHVKEDLLARAKRAFAAIERRYGARGLAQVAQGLAAARTLAASARNNLGEQLDWLSSVERYRSMALAISARIEAEVPDIDRETFVEPREMCSTTHVHDDHRLVVIESGNMVFWGNLGMTLRLAPGEMVLVPQGRLHGSSIESDNCVYHQPIIPDAWIRSVVNEFSDMRAAE